MSKRYNTTSSPLFSNKCPNKIPAWMKQLDQFKANKQDAINIDFQKLASFADAPKVSRDNRDYNSKPVNNKITGERLKVAAKVELAKFLSGKYYNTNAQGTDNNVELVTKISNIPATFSFKYACKNGKVIGDKQFTIKLADGTFGEYPFSQAGLTECLDDIKTGNVKTGELAESYQAYTITLEEILRRFNGDQRAAMDRVRELVASQDIIGVESNTFASVYSMDSLFPQMKKEGSADKAPTFEFMPNKEHVAANPNSSGAKLLIEASKLLHNFFSDFKINSSNRHDDILTVNAMVDNNGINNTINFNFEIEDDKVKHIASCDLNGNIISLQKLLDNLNKTNILTAYLKNNTSKSKIYNGIILTTKDINNKLFKIASKDTIDSIITNWAERKLIQRIASNKFVTKLSFLDLLNNVNAELLSKDEKERLNDNIKRITADINRIKQDDTGIRNDKELMYSKSIRLANLYNHIHNSLDKFKLLEANDDCTKLTLMNYSERAPEKVTVAANFKGNTCISADIIRPNMKSIALNLYKQANKHNVFAKSIFSEAMLKRTITGIFKDTNRIVSLIKKKFNLIDIGNNFYASDIPLSSIINVLEQAKNITAMNDDERKELLAARAYFGKKLQAEYINDTGIRNDKEWAYSKSIRLANIYHSLSKKFKAFLIKNVNDECTNVSIIEKTPIGDNEYKVIIEYNDNQPEIITYLNTKNADEREIIKCYKQENTNNLKLAKSVFSKNIVKNALKSLVPIDKIDNAVNIVCAKAKDIGNGFYASNEPLVYLINNSDLPFEKTYDEQKHFGTSLNRQDVQDTGVRDDLEESAINLINKASLYLHNYFKDFKVKNVKIDNQRIFYTARLFDEDTGLTNTLNFEFQLDGNNIKECSINADGKRLSIEAVKKTFASNDILKRYLKYHTGKKTNAPIVFSIDRFIQQTKNLTNATDNEIKNTLSQLCHSGKLERLSSNTYASQYTIEQLLSISNLKALTDDEIKTKLSKGIRNTLWKVSQAHIQDSDNRQLTNEWDINKFVQFAKSEINKKYKQFEIIDASLSDDNFIIKARVDNKGLRTLANFNWQLQDGKPIKAHVDIDTPNDVVNKFINAHKSINNNIVISKAQLKQKVLGFININYIDKICDKLVKRGVFKPIETDKYASKYSLADIVNALANSKLVSKADEQLALANRQTPESFDSYNMSDASRFVPKQEKVLDANMKQVRDKLANNIQIALNNKLITANKFNSWNELLNKATTKNDIENVYREFKQYLR